MADSWYDYLQGSPEQRLADLEKQRAQHDAMSADPRWAMLSPRQKMMAAGDTLAPTRTSDAASDLGTAAEYVLDAGVRPRDTAIRAAQELYAGNPMRAAGLAAAAIPSAVFPELAAGKPGSEDDWRKHGNPAVSFALDMATVKPSIETISSVLSIISFTFNLPIDSFFQFLIKLIEKYYLNKGYPMTFYDVDETKPDQSIVKEIVLPSLNFDITK
jgi:hypothetical protein